MDESQFNKLQIKAEILTVISKLQTNLEAANIDETLETLNKQEDKKSILDVLAKELIRANEQKSILICFLLLKLCEKEKVENALWEVLKNPSAADSTKTIILNVLKDIGNKVDYDKLEEYFESPNDVIDADTKKLLHVAIVNPEAQIDFLDFLNSLSDLDKTILIQSLGDDYSSDDLANILNPLVLYNPACELGKIAVNILGTTKSQLALHTLLDALEFVEDEETIALIKRNISTLKIAGVREDNAIEFYSGILSASKPYLSYASYPDGHGNQALIFSRERTGVLDTIQIVAVVVNDSDGIVDCFGFNEISKTEFERIVARFYNGDEYVYINSPVVKNILLNAEKTTRKSGGKLSYEYICWKTLLSDVQAEPVPIELILKTEFNQVPISDEDLEKIYMFDFLQRWFLDTDYSDEFRSMAEGLNKKFSEDDFKIDLDKIVNDNLEKIFTIEQKTLLDKRILMSAYLRYLSVGAWTSKSEAQLLYSLYFDENKKSELAKNIIRKSLYEYYVSLKFKYKEEHKMTNIFTMRNKPKTLDLTSKQVDLAISMIESLWTNA
ncbi:MAG: hypothetical protein WCY19_06150 [Candidatus Gastranaerophilaceae bacterium]